MEATQGEKSQFVIFINKKEYKVTESSLTGEQILARGGYSSTEYDLFLVQGQKSEQIQPTQTVEMKNGLHFNAIKKSVPYG